MICGQRPGNRRRLCSSGTRMRPTAERTWNANREGGVLFFSSCWFSFAVLFARSLASYGVPFFVLAFRPSFSTIASTTKSCTAISCVTQCSLRRR